MNAASGLGHLGSLQVMRVVAASLVVFMHSLNLAAAYMPGDTTAAWRAFGVHFGHAGVDIFFVISGFIMFLIAGRDVAAAGSGPPASARFLVRRAARIYPVFWISLFVFAFLPSQSWRDGDYHRLFDHPLSLFLLDAPGPMHPVAWTLVFEVAFYLAVAGLMLFGPRYLRFGFFILCVAQTTLVLLATVGLLPQFALLLPISLEFGIGIALGWLVLSGKNAMPGAVLVAGIAWLAAAMLLIPPESVASGYARVFGFAFPAAAILYGLIILERKQKFTPPRVLVAGGDISYSLYLWHLPVLIAVAVALQATGLFPRPSWAVALLYVVVSAGLTVGVSLVVFRWIEMPFMLWASAWTKAPPPEGAQRLPVDGARRTSA